MTTDPNHPAAPAAVESSEPAAEPSFIGPSAAEPSAAPRRRRGWRGWAIGGLAVALLAAGGLFVAGRDANGEEAAEAAAAEGEREDEEKAPIPVEVAVVETGAIASYLSATANLIAPGEVDVVAETEGRVERVLVVEGDWVAKGQLLATLARGDAEIALEKARVREENAVAVHQRGLDLAAEQLISREDLEKRDMDARLAKQERAEAEWNLAKTEVRAPIGGRVTLRHTQPGRHVSPGDPLFHLTDRDLVAYVYLPEKDVLALDLGRRVELALDAAPDVAFHGRIRQISPVVDPATGTVKVTVEAVSPPAAVRPGSFVTARIVRERRPDAVLLPKDAVIRELAQAHVFVARRDGDALVAARREIALGLEEESRVEAVSGLRPGERLIVAGQGALKDGTRIRVLGDGAAEGKG